MTALLDFPVATAPDSHDPLSVVASVVRSFDQAELTVALSASGARLTRSMCNDVDTLVSLAQLGTVGMGVDEVTATAQRVTAIRHAMVAALRADLPGDEAAEAYARLLGGKRRSVLASDLARRLVDHFRPRPIAVVPYACDPS